MNDYLHTPRGGPATRPSFLLLGSTLLLLALLPGCWFGKKNRTATAPRQEAAPVVRNLQPFGIKPADPRKPLRSFEQIVALPEDEFDLAEALLTLAPEIRPENAGAVEAGAVLTAIDELASRVRGQLPENPDGIDFCDALYDVVLDHKAAEGWREDRWEDYDLACAVRKKRGTCLSIGILALTVARRVDAPLAGMQCPGHFLLKCTTVETRKQSSEVFFDVTRPMPDDWRKLDEAAYRKWYPFHEQAWRNGSYLTPLRDQQVLAVYLASRAGWLSLEQRHSEALRDADRALKLHPGNVTAHINGGYALESMGRLEEAQLSYQQALCLDPASLRALNNLATLKTRDPHSTTFAPKEAQRLIESALRLAPQKAYLHATQAEVLAASGDWRAATRAIQTAIGLDRKNTQYRRRFLELRARLRGEE